MAIDVICTGCHKRFQVSEQFAGKQGPCPGCQTIIEIPKVEDLVIVHERETTRTGAPAKLDSIVRQKTTVNKFELYLSLATLFGGLAMGFALRFTLDEANPAPGSVVTILAGALLGIGSSLLGYIVLRPQDTEIRNDRKTILKGGCVGLVYAALWRLQELAISGLLTEDGSVILPAVIVLALALVAVASFIPMFVYEFEYSQGLIHVILFIAALAAYCMLLGDIAFIGR